VVDSESDGERVEVTCEKVNQEETGEDRVDEMYKYHFVQGSLVTRCEAPGGIGSSSGGWPTIFHHYFGAVRWVF